MTTFGGTSERGGADEVVGRFLLCIQLQRSLLARAVDASFME